MLPTSNSRTLAAAGLLIELREAEANCTLTSLTPEELLRLASSGDEEAFVELRRRRDPEPIAA